MVGQELGETERLARGPAQPGRKGVSRCQVIPSFWERFMERQEARTGNRVPKTRSPNRVEPSRTRGRHVVSLHPHLPAFGVRGQTLDALCVLHSEILTASHKELQASGHSTVSSADGRSPSPATRPPPPLPAHPWWPFDDCAGGSHR